MQLSTENNQPPSSPSLLKTENVSPYPPSAKQESSFLLAAVEKGKNSRDESSNAPLECANNYRHVELVNVDLTADVLMQHVENWLHSGCLEQLISISLDDNALGEASIEPISKILLNADNLKDLSLQNISMTDSFLSRLIGFGAQLKNRSEGNSLKIDIRSNGLLTERGALSLAAGRRFLPTNITFVDDF